MTDDSYSRYTSEPGDAQARIAKALAIAPDAMYDGDHHKMWVVDQMVRALTGCPIVQEAAIDAYGKSYEFNCQGESGEYQRFVAGAGEWDEGIAP